MPAVTLSPDLIEHVEWFFWRALDEGIGGGVVREGSNVFTQHATPAYICAVAAVEAFVNEAVFGLPAFPDFDQSPLGILDRDWIKKLELKQKLIIIPQLLFGRTFSKRRQPYQDMALLIRVRNDLVHYKMAAQTPSYIATLEQREVVLARGESGADYVWVHKLSCSEGIRWANNTVCRVVHEFAAMAPDDGTAPFIRPLADNFREIRDDAMRDRIHRLESAK